MNKKTWVILATLLTVAFAFGIGVWRFQQKKQEHDAVVAREATQGAAQMLDTTSARKFGSPEAKVTIVEFFDPACEACRAFYTPVKQIVNTSFGRVNLVLRYAPLHKGSDQAAAMLEAAALQGKYWQAVEAALASQDLWASHDSPDVNKLWQPLAAAGVDIARAQADMNSPAIKEIIAKDIAALTALKVQRTPTFFVNGQPLTDFGTEQLKALIKQEIGKAYGA
jgi:protein-disulfide isomerase